MFNIKFPNAEHVNYLCQIIINDEIYKTIQENYLKNISKIEINQIVKEAESLIINKYNIIDKLALTKILVRNAQNRASQILEGKIPLVLCNNKFKQKVFYIIFNESLCKAEKQILRAISFIFLQELSKIKPSSIEETHAALQYFISASLNLKIDSDLIKINLENTLDKYLNKNFLPFFKKNATIVGQAGKEIIRSLQKSNALSYEAVINYLDSN